MSISEQAKELRETANRLAIGYNITISVGVKQFRSAADTIEALSAKLANMERLMHIQNTTYDAMRKELKHSVIDLKADHYNLSEFMRVIDEVFAKYRSFMERSEDCDGWIPCKDRLPEDGIDVLVWYEYFRYGEYNRLFQTTGISYTFNGEWSGLVNGSSGWRQLRIIAWQPLPEPYDKP